MTFSLPPDLESFVLGQMATGQYETEEDLFRSAFHALAERDEDLAAVNEAIDEWRAGDLGSPVDEVVDAIRRKHGLQANS